MKKKRAKDKLEPFIKAYSEIVFEELVKNKVIIQISHPKEDQKTVYQISESIQKHLTSSENISSIENNLIKSYRDFRHLLKNVYSYLGYPETNKGSEMTITQYIDKFQTLKAFKTPIQIISRVKDIFDKGEDLLSDAEILKDAEGIFKEQKINLNTLIYELIEFYTLEKIKKILGSELIFKEVSGFEKHLADFIAINSKTATDVLIEIKYRKTTSNIKSIISSTVENLKTYNKIHNKTNDLILFLYTQEDSSVFDKLKYKYQQNFEKDFPEFINQIHFIPVSTNYLHLIDYEIKKIRILDKVKKVNFVNQTPIDGNINNNDHYLDKVFDLGDKSIEINLNPLTLFWRFGFKFSRMNKFPSLDGTARHIDGDYVDIHLCIGDPKENNGRYFWQYPERIYLSEYHIKPLVDEFKIYTDYDQKPIKLKFSRIKNFIYKFEVFINNKSIGHKTYDLSGFKHFIIGAWADQIPFELEAEIAEIE